MGRFFDTAKLHPYQREMLAELARCPGRATRHARWMAIYGLRFPYMARAIRELELRDSIEAARVRREERDGRPIQVIFFEEVAGIDIDQAREALMELGNAILQIPAKISKLSPSNGDLLLIEPAEHPHPHRGKRGRWANQRHDNLARTARHAKGR